LYRTTTTQLARQLRELGAGVDDLLENLAATLTLLDRTGRIRWQNEASLARVGDRRGQHYLELISPEHRHSAEKEFQRIKETVGDWSRRAVVVVADRLRVRSLAITIPLRSNGEFAGALSLGLPLEEDPPTWRLTPRLLETLDLLADGRTTQEIATALGVSLETARNHIRRLLRALGVHSRLEAVARGRELGILDSDASLSGDEWRVSSP
jgi:DNA-binding CsgD family transcriptional regulator